MCHLLGADGQGIPSEPINTFSAGVAMIALAARANGANIRVECMFAAGQKRVLPPVEESDLGRNPLVLRLWLIEPPPEIADRMDVPHIGTISPEVSSMRPQMLTLYGGDQEISLTVATQVGFSCSPEKILSLWTKGIAKGAQARWKTLTQNTSTLVLRLSLNDPLQSPTFAELPLSDAYYQGLGRLGILHYLDQIADSIYDDVFGNLGDGHVPFAENRSRARPLIIVSLGLGCLKSSTKHSEGLLSCYAWTFDCTKREEDSINTFYERAIRDGIALKDILWTAARVWGESDYVDHGHVKVHERVLGIACPRLTVMSTALTDIRGLALDGLDTGIFSLYEGSIPILPRDPISGYVIAGKSPASQEPRKVVTRGFRFSPLDGYLPNIIYNIEPYQHQGSLSVLLCGWYQGDVYLELDLINVLLNLFQRGLNCQDPPRTMAGCTLQHLACQDLLLLGEFQIKNVVGVIRTGPSMDWVYCRSGLYFSWQSYPS